MKICSINSIKYLTCIILLNKYGENKTNVPQTADTQAQEVKRLDQSLQQALQDRHQAPLTVQCTQECDGARKELIRANDQRSSL